MKSYPSITTKIDFSKPYHIFDKLDGSNIRVEWSKAKGFYKFGSRTQLLTPDQVKLFPSIENFKNKYSEQLSSVFSKSKFERAISFFEWLGPNSFAGSHPDPIEDMDSILIDIAVYKKGILPPEQFLELSGDAETPKLLYVGKIDEEFFQSVRNRTLEGMSFEGVVGKGEYSQKDGGPIAFKIKSNDWLNKLKSFCNGNDELYQRLK